MIRFTSFSGLKYCWDNQHNPAGQPGAFTIYPPGDGKSSNGWRRKEKLVNGIDGEMDGDGILNAPGQVVRDAITETGDGRQQHKSSTTPNMRPTEEQGRGNNPQRRRL